MMMKIAMKKDTKKQPRKIETKGNDKEILRRMFSLCFRFVRNTDGNYAFLKR